MLTKRSKSMKECYEQIIADFDKMKKANETLNSFIEALNADRAYSKEYKAERAEVARASTDNTLSICAGAILDNVNKLADLIEGDPEPVDVTDSKKQNVMSMITTLGEDLPFEQITYFVESARGDFRWLEILGKMLRRYGFSYQAELCDKYREAPAEWQLAEFAGKMACVQQRPREFLSNNFGRDMVNFKKWLNVLEVSVNDTADLANQVERYKKELAATRAENESLKERDALHVGIINHMIDKNL